MRERKARSITHKGEVYYDIASTARLLRTNVTKIKQLMAMANLNDAGASWRQAVGACKKHRRIQIPLF
jgi:hypothetical protein